MLDGNGRTRDAAKVLATFEVDRWVCLYSSGDVDIGICDKLRSFCSLFGLFEEGGVNPVEYGVMGSLVDAPKEEPADWEPLVGFCISSINCGFLIGGPPALEAASAKG